MTFSEANTALSETGDTSEVCTALDEMKDTTRRRVRAASMLTGSPVRNGAGEDLGHIEHIMIDIPSGRVVYAVLSFGGILGIGDAWVAVPWNVMRIDEKALIESFVLDIDRETLESAPRFPKDRWPDMADPAFAAAIHRHYRRTAMDHNFGRLSEEQENDARAAVHNFIRRHDISDWAVKVNLQKTATGKYIVRIVIMPRPESGLQWLVQEIELADGSFDVAGDVDRLLELAWQDHLREN
jgi:sporulation protein YlmC with PRC-barrel domain